MSQAVARPSPLVKSLYTHNPFYAISAVLMLYSVRAAYGELEIGFINSWVMTAVLAGYTSLLGGIGVLLVRKGEIWEDVRSVLLLTVLLFLGISICADDLLVNAESVREGAVLVLAGYLFSALVSEVVLRLSRIRLPWIYRGPYHLFLMLFFVTPWVLSPELRPADARSVEWLILLFPVAAGIITLMLLPAVRRGAEAVRDNGTPWGWPLYPWTIFFLLIGGAMIRTYALSMTFGPSGPIWNYSASGGRTIDFSTIWGPYFLIPMLFPVLILMLESGIQGRNEKLLRGLMFAAPALLLLALPLTRQGVFDSFYQHVTYRIGSPLWLTLCLLLGFYLLAWVRRVPQAAFAVLLMGGLFAVVTPRTDSLQTLGEPNPWVLLSLGIVLAANTLWTRSSLRGAVATLLLTSGVYQILGENTAFTLRHTLCFHLLWFGVIAIGLGCRDQFARVFHVLGAFLFPVVCAVAMLSPKFREIPLEWKAGYLAGAVVLFLLISRLWRSRWYLGVTVAVALVAVYEVVAIGFRAAAGVLGWQAITAFLWSLAALMIGLLISAHKANWIPESLQRWLQRRQPIPEPALLSPDDHPEVPE